jgi:hypothetical protein
MKYARFCHTTQLRVVIPYRRFDAPSRSQYIVPKRRKRKYHATLRSVVWERRSPYIATEAKSHTEFNELLQMETRRQTTSYRMNTEQNCAVVLLI